MGQGVSRHRAESTDVVRRWLRSQLQHLDVYARSERDDIRYDFSIRFYSTRELRQLGIQRKWRFQRRWIFRWRLWWRRRRRILRLHNGDAACCVSTKNLIEA